MINFYDIAYGTGVVIASPFWLLKSKARTKVLRAFGERFGHVNKRESKGPAVLIHAVSLGEINATRELVRQLQEKRPDLHVIVSTTTDTGFERGQQLFTDPAKVTLIRFPIDFSAAVNRVLDRLRPDVVVLMELELWPNFLRQCAKRNIRAVLINGRLTTSSFSHYKWVKPIAKKMFSRIATLAVQDQTYADRFIALGAPVDRLGITGTMKFDTANISQGVEGDKDLAAAVGLKPGEEKIWVCGSTGPGEEELILSEYRNLQSKGIRLVIVPRHPQRFDDVAQLIEKSGFPIVRRSHPQAHGSAVGPNSNSVVLGDTMGELKKFYSIADVIFVGRTLVDLGPRQHGSDMIEPAALAKPTIVGPFTHNFADAMNKFRAAAAILEISDGPALGRAINATLSNPTDANDIGRRAQDVVRLEMGATKRHVDIILKQLDRKT